MKPGVTSGELFKLSYQLQFHKITKYTDETGRFDNMVLLIAAKSLDHALKLLKPWHDDGVPESITWERIDRCVIVDS